MHKNPKILYDHYYHSLFHQKCVQQKLRSFWPSMFADTIPMLEAIDPIFSSKETYKIMFYLENQLVPLLEKFKKSLNQNNNEKDMTEWKALLQKAPYANDDTAPKHSFYEKISFMIQLIRRSCTRNLTRALIIENTNV